MKEAKKKEIKKSLPYEIIAIIVLVAGSKFLDLDTTKEFIFLGTVVLYSFVNTLKNENVIPINRVVLDVKEKDSTYTIRMGANVKMSKTDDDTVKSLSFKRVQ